MTAFVAFWARTNESFQNESMNAFTASISAEHYAKVTALGQPRSQYLAATFPINRKHAAAISTLIWQNAIKAAHAAKIRNLIFAFKADD